MRGPGRADSALLRVRVQPRAFKDELVGWDGATLRVRVCAAPVDGEANDALLALLARTFRLPRSAVTLVRGSHARDKLVSIQGCSLATLAARLKAGLL
ncbi:MAG: DUF167 domain-containing protein [Candidatus Rokubacteria bacterium]|nr:DUF167 domain-containing protein [Candidatus Rokubacteria bacterium]MBI2544142.1 DUF167 domain-containing protein [Candidatus Rokubacteria bacterium]MBI2552866.1 DUF167 domain-containing protein [Candidatus Rokubacteria bacterium]